MDIQVVQVGGDADSIKGSRKEKDIQRFYEDKKKLLALIKTDEALLRAEEVNYPDDYYKSLPSNKEKIRFLRIVQGKKQEEVADLLDIHVRTVQRIEKAIREEMRAEMS